MDRPQTHLEDGKPSIGLTPQRFKLPLSLTPNLSIIASSPQQLLLQLGHLHERLEGLCQVAHTPQVVPIYMFIVYIYVKRGQGSQYMQ